MRSSSLLAAILCLAALLCSCRATPDPIVVQSDRITVFNHTDGDWRDVELRVNRYYMVKISLLAAGGRFDVPVGRLQGGVGRYFDRKREHVRSVHVTATSETGPVNLAWTESGDPGA